MLFIQGHLYLKLPERVCNAYLLGDQENTAKAMILSAAVAGLFLIIKAYNQTTATLTPRWRGGLHLERQPETRSTSQCAGSWWVLHRRCRFAPG